MEITETVQEYYEKLWREKTGSERVQRVCSLRRSMYNTIALQIRKAEPWLTERQVKILVARRFYASDEKAQQLLDLAWEDANRNR